MQLVHVISNGLQFVSNLPSLPRGDIRGSCIISTLYCNMLWNFLPVNKCLREGWNECFWKGVQCVSDPGLCSGVWAALEDSCSLFGVWFMHACCRSLFLYCWRRNWPGCSLQSYKSIHAGLAESPVFHLSFWSAAAKLYPIKISPS